MYLNLNHFQFDEVSKNIVDSELTLIDFNTFKEKLKTILPIYIQQSSSKYSNKHMKIDECSVYVMYNGENISGFSFRFLSDFISEFKLSLGNFENLSEFMQYVLNNQNLILIDMQNAVDTVIQERIAGYTQLKNVMQNFFNDIQMPFDFLTDKSILGLDNYTLNTKPIITVNDDLTINFKFNQNENLKELFGEDSKLLEMDLTITRLYNLIDFTSLKLDVGFFKKMEKELYGIVLDLLDVLVTETNIYLKNIDSEFIVDSDLYDLTEANYKDIIIVDDFKTITPFTPIM